MADGQIVQFKDQYKNVMVAMKKREGQFKSLLPSYIPVDKWFGVISRSIQNNPKLLECTESSLIGCLFQAAQLGLECDGVTREAYLVPFRVKGKMTCTLIPGYPGYLKLIRNSALVGSIMTQAVWAKDEFDYELGTTPFIKHKRSPEPPQKDEEPICFYSTATLKDGSVQFEIMFPWEVKEIRDGSQGYRYIISQGRTDTPWIEDFVEMAKKTVFIRLSKWLPKSTEMSRALQLNMQADEGQEQDFSTFMDITAETVEPEAIPEKTGTGSKLDELAKANQSKAGKAKEQTQAPNPEDKEPNKPGPSYADSEPDPTKPGGDLFGKK
jgi:recombination protein RecT